MIALAAAPVDVRVFVPHSPAYEGDWIPLALILRRATDAHGAVRVRAVTCSDPDVQLDLDLLDRETPIRPGESYRLTVPVRARRAKVVELGCISVHVLPDGAAREEPIELPATVLSIRPALGRHLAVSLEPLCKYDGGTKVLLTLRHVGSVGFQDLTVNLSPADAIRGGKATIQRPSFQSAELEQLELVIAGNQLDIDLAATIAGERTEARQTLPIGEPPVVGERRIQFLEPRRLSTDVITMLELSGEKATAVGASDGVCAVHGGSQYHLIIRPQHPGVSSITVRDIPGVIHVRDRQDTGDGGWRFLLDVSYGDLFRKPEVLYYDVRMPGDHLTGEVPICLQPPWMRHWQVAGALGVALTVQGLAAVARFLHNLDFDLTGIAADFDLRQDYNLLFLFSILTRGATA